MDESADTNLKICEGDCDNDSDCVGDLICYERDGTNLETHLPGCQGIPEYGWDYCVNPYDQLTRMLSELKTYSTYIN